MPATVHIPELDNYARPSIYQYCIVFFFAHFLLVFITIVRVLGAVMIFTALLSVAFLGQKIKIYMWLGNYRYNLLERKPQAMS